MYGNKVFDIIVVLIIRIRRALTRRSDGLSVKKVIKKTFEKEGVVIELFHTKKGVFEINLYVIDVCLKSEIRLTICEET